MAAGEFLTRPVTMEFEPSVRFYMDDGMVQLLSISLANTESHARDYEQGAMKRENKPA